MQKARPRRPMTWCICKIRTNPCLKALITAPAMPTSNHQRGGKSLIMSCKDLHLSRVVCYKTLRPELANDPIEQQRLLREARVSALLQHPNTIPTYEVGRDGKGKPYFTMKLVHGYTLREVLDYRERYDLTQLLEVLLHCPSAAVRPYPRRNPSRC